MWSSKTWWMATVACALAHGAHAQDTRAIAELFGRADAISDVQLSPNGTQVATMCSPAGFRTACIFPLDSGADATVIPRLEQGRATRNYWAKNDTLIIDFDAFERLQTSGGLFGYEFERAIAYNAASKKATMLMRDNRAWLDTNNLAAVLPSENNKNLLSIVGLSQSQGSSIDSRFLNSERKLVLNIVETDLKSGRSKVREKLTDHVVDAVLAADGSVIAEVSYKQETVDNQEIWVKAGGKRIFYRNNLKYDPLTVWGHDPTTNSLVVFLEEDGAGDLYRMSLADGALSEIALDPRGGKDVDAIVDPRTRQVVGIQQPGDVMIQTFFDKNLKSQLQKVVSAFSGAVVTIESWTDDRSQSVVRVEKSGKPADYYILDATSGGLSPLGNEAPHLDGRALGNIERITYTAADGLQIPAYLTLPPGKSRSDGPFKLIVLPHGGPEANDTLTFDWWVQAYAAAGYAVLQPNFRGSTGNGVEFRNKGYGEFGGKMVSDVLDGVRWAVSQNLARRGEVCAAGASYGGYSALMLGATGRDEIRCVISVNGVTNPVKLLGEVSPDGFTYNYLTRYMGIDRFSDSASRDPIIPVKRANDITAPILLIASREDVTVPFDQSQAMKSVAGDKAQLVTIEGEDHYLSSTKARFAVLNESLTFLNQHLPVR